MTKLILKTHCGSSTGCDVQYGALLMAFGYLLTEFNKQQAQINNLKEKIELIQTPINRESVSTDQTDISIETTCQTVKLH